ncbi:MAG TPA: DMT family transporter, partial [Actinomycetota bacterium]|nr:DMT family transporter [Actinomycetota bacterium]
MNLGIPLGLSSGLCWGAADFFGGIQSRRLPALTVAFWSQLAGALGLAVALAIQGAGPAGSGFGSSLGRGAALGFWPAVAGAVESGVAWGLAAGVGSGCALVLFYRGLAEGTMSVVAPISACGAVVPVAAAVLTGNQPGALAALGILAAITGVVLVSRPRPRPPSTGTPVRSGRVVAMALGSALGFGLFYVFVDAGTAAAGTSGSSSSPLRVIAGARTSSLAILSAIALFSRRSALRWPGRRIGVVALVGIGDTGANLLFAYAATTGNLAVVGVLGSLYPVSTVILARWLLGERLSGGQNAGVV